MPQEEEFFDDEILMDLEDESEEEISNGKNFELPKGDFAVDHLDLQLLNPVIRILDVSQRNMLPLKMLTDFKKKYYRFDNKMLQCFPNCSRFPDVREARLMGKDHRSDKRSQAWCSNPVQAVVMAPDNVNLSNIHVVGRFLCATPEAAVLPESDTPLLEVGMATGFIPSANCIPGSVLSATQLGNGRVELNVAMQPDEAWFFNLQLPRHRRNPACAAHKVPLFLFEILVFVQTGPQAFTVCARSVCAPFEIASVRTLIREVLACRQLRKAAALNPVAPAPVHLEAIHTAVEEDRKPKAARRVPMNYSSTVHRVRLHHEAEANKKKMELVVKVTEEPKPIVIPEWMKDEAFELPEIDFALPPMSSVPQHQMFTSTPYQFQLPEDDEFIPC